ncbi:ferritin-like domain-containing protein [Chryseolinea soli]|uniref:Ferritin-like domain-containing protein n=1 Tax=Chryseolinea soli TaxID=2321403 RepID=A0A385SPT2_9BACT|nr:ferritin-like domain-containing protein [Chryseolinea soli]AYB33014.1 ferritin-like domain-containing protein [Chryseolinea soli]
MKKTMPLLQRESVSDHTSKLERLFEDELKDIYWAEKALVRALPKLLRNVTSEELYKVLEDHLTETEDQVVRIEGVFATLGKEPKAKKCEAMAGLIREAEAIMSHTQLGAMRDAGIISAVQKVEHYEMASYGTLRTFASTLGLDKAVSLLQENLDEERAADSKLSELAVSAIHFEAAER